MKNIILFLVVFLYSYSLFAKEETINIYLENDSIQTLTLNDIQNISILKGQSNLIMKIFSNGELTASYPTSDIDSLNFESINGILRNLLVFIPGSATKSHLIFDIDSIIFSIPNVAAPVIDDIEPTEALIGENITITGSNFGETQSGSSVSFTGATALTYSSWKDTEIVVEVPVGAQSGFVSVLVNATFSNQKSFKVVPNITDINPKSGKPGEVITITGSGFNPMQGTSRVYFESTLAKDFISWTDTEIKVKVPVGAVSGLVYVKIKSLSSNEVDFTVIEVPTISSIDPESFTIGSQVTIDGSGFGSDETKGKVYFNTKQATDIVYWNESQIKCTVPAGATSGKISVTVNSEKSNEVSYTIEASIETVLIPSGNFQMGNTGSMSGGMQPEIPVHQVNISKSFNMSKYEVTQKLYTSVMGNNPSNFKGEDLPVDRVSWLLAVEFCNKLSEREGLEECYTINGNNVTCNWNADGWRLPTEAEWEYACKAGTSTDFYNGDSESDLANAGWYSVNSGDKTHIGGQKEENAFGLYDMLGNLSELCWDWIGEYSGGTQTDPKGPSSGTWKVARGGSWHQGANLSRSSMRGWIDEIDMQSSAVGFRILRND